ncbi:MAG: Gfo/Idh/MocA family oxidoreductase, partial [Clostridiales bacterium]|nr:Gfo/Idh/MocA family oxidoreductase [Clostridiales bacterium]
PMKLGIMGTGKIVQEVLPLIASLHPEKWYLMGREHSAERTRELCRRYQADGYFLSAGDLLEADIDTVYLALPNSLHFSFAKKAIAAGKHVIIEKPITVYSRELKELAADAEAQEVFLLEAMSLHYTPAFRSLKEQLPALGPIRLVNFQFCQYSSRYDDFCEGKIAPAFDPACMGGALMDLNVYNLHAILSLFGKPRDAQYFPNMQRGVDTSGVVTLDYGSFKAVSLAAKDCQAPVASVIQGEDACLTIRMPMNQIDRYEISDHKGNVQVFDFHNEKHRLYPEFTELERIIREKDADMMRKLLKVSMDAVELLEQLRPY